MSTSSELSVRDFMLKRYFLSTVRSYLWIFFLILQLLGFSNLYHHFNIKTARLIWKSLVYAFVLLSLNMPNQIYTSTIFIVQPFKRFSLWEKFKEYLHVNQIMFWTLIPLQYVVYCLVNSLWSSCSLSFTVRVVPCIVLLVFVHRSVYYLYMWKNSRYDYTPSLSLSRSRWSVLPSVWDSLLISTASLLCVSTVSFLLRLFLPSSSFSTAFSSFWSLFVLSLLQSIPDLCLRQHLTADLSLAELGVGARQSLPLSRLLRSLVASVGRPVSIRDRSHTASCPLEDSLYLLQPVARSMGVMNKSEWVCGWREVYRRVERQYQEVFDTVEKDRFVSLDRPAFSSGGKLLSHLQWKTLLRLLAIAEVSEIRSFVYDPSLQPMTDLNGSALTIVLNTTLQLQITWRSYQQALPLALKKPHHFTRLCFSDLRRTIYAVRAMTTVVMRCDPINLVFEDVVFVWILAVLSLYDISRTVKQQVGSERDLDILISTIDDFLYQVFNNAKISFDHLAIPQEYYGIYLHFHELGDH